MRRTTLLPPPKTSAVKRGRDARTKLEPLCPIRMAEAERADAEFLKLANAVAKRASSKRPRTKRTSLCDRATVRS